MGSETVEIGPHHRALVAACTVDDEAFPVAFDECLRQIEIDGVDPVSAELLPLLYRRAEDAGLDRPERRRLRYFYLQTWRHNQALLHRARPVFEHLDRMPGRWVVLKGGAIASSRHRGDLGVRPMGDLDVLVAPEVAFALIEWMLRNGWRVDDTLGWTHVQYLRAHHAVSMHHGSDGAIDVHVGLLSTDRSPSLDAELRSRAVPATLGGEQVHVLDTSAQVMHTLSHSNPHGVRHLVDALHLVNARSAEIEWDWVCDQVIARRSIARTLETVDRLRSLDPAAAPAAATERLSSAERHWSDWSYQGRPMASLEGTKIFLSRLAQRSRGETPWGKVRIAALLARHYAHAATAD